MSIENETDLRKVHEFVDEKEDPYRYFRGKFVEIGYGQSAYFGKYMGLTKNSALVLNPHLSFSVTFGSPRVPVIKEDVMLLNYSSRGAIVVLPRTLEEITEAIDRHLGKPAVKLSTQKPSFSEASPAI